MSDPVDDVIVQIINQLPAEWILEAIARNIEQGLIPDLPEGFHD